METPGPGVELRSPQAPVPTPPAPGGLASQLLPAWHDRVAGVTAYSGAICTANLHGHGHQLIIADEDRKLKVWSGHVRESEHVLLDVPVAVAAFHAAAAPAAKLAVAAGAHVYIYNGLRPYHKITLPEEAVEPADAAVWEQATEEGTSEASAAAAVAAQLRALRNAGVPLCRRSRDLAAAEDDVTAAAYVAATLGRPLADPAFVTAMTTAYLGQNDDGAPSTVVVATEAGTVAVIDNASMQVQKQWHVGGVPALLAAHGSLHGNYTLFVALRTAALRVVRDGALLLRPLSLQAEAVALAIAGGALYVATTASALALYDIVTFARQAGVALPSPPVAMTVLPCATARLVAVAMRDCSVVIYAGTIPVSRHETAAHVLGLRSGPLMTEESALIAVLEGGGLDVRFLSRRAKVSGTRAAAAAAAAAAEQTPLPVPKKTKLYVEFAKRERDNAQALYHAFQQDLLKLRLRTAEAYVKVLTGGAAPGPAAQYGGHLSLVTSVLGLGPSFKLQLKVANTGSKALCHLRACLSWNEELYELNRRSLPLPALVPGLQYVFEVKVECLSPESGATGDVNVLLVGPGSSAPLVATAVAMPVSEVDDTDN